MLPLDSNIARLPAPVAATMLASTNRQVQWTADPIAPARATASNKSDTGPWPSALPGRLHGALRKMPAGVTPARARGPAGVAETGRARHSAALAGPGGDGRHRHPGRRGLPASAAVPRPHARPGHLQVRLRRVYRTAHRRPPHPQLALRRAPPRQGVLFSGGAERATGDGRARATRSTPNSWRSATSSPWRGRWRTWPAGCTGPPTGISPGLRVRVEGPTRPRPGDRSPRGAPARGLRGAMSRVIRGARARRNLRRWPRRPHGRGR